MSEIYFKAVRMDGTDWWSGTVRWLPEDGIIPEGGWLVEHPTPGPVGDCDAGGYLSVATIPTDCTGMGWPTRLLRVEPVGEVWTPHPDTLPRKRAAHSWRVIEERPAHEALGPQGREAAALIEIARGLTSDQMDALAAARDAAWGAAWGAAWNAAWNAALDAVWTTARAAARTAVWDAAWYVARAAALDAIDTVLAVLARDLISAEQYDLLTEPWRTVMGDPMGEMI